MTASPGRAPVRYTLRVDGRLDARWAEWFDGFTITAESDGTTTLIGVVADQAQLHGVLAKIRDLGVALISLTAARDSGKGAGSDVVGRRPHGEVT